MPLQNVSLSQRPRRWRHDVLQTIRLHRIGQIQKRADFALSNQLVLIGFVPIKELTHLSNLLLDHHLREKTADLKFGLGWPGGAFRACRHSKQETDTAEKSHSKKPSDYGPYKDETRQHSVPIMQLRFTSLAVISLWRDLHAGRIGRCELG